MGAYRLSGNLRILLPDDLPAEPTDAPKRPKHEISRSLKKALAPSAITQVKEKRGDYAALNAQSRMRKRSERTTKHYPRVIT